MRLQLLAGPRWASLLSGLALVAAHGSAGRSGHADWAGENRLPPPCPATCYNLCFPDGLWYAGSGAGNYDPFHPNCNMASCGGCQPTLAPGQFERAVELVTTASLASVREALRRYPSMVSLNLERSAVQVRCGDTIAAHVSLPPYDVASLALELGPLAD